MLVRHNLVSTRVRRSTFNFIAQILNAGGKLELLILRSCLHMNVEFIKSTIHSIMYTKLSTEEPFFMALSYRIDIDMPTHQ